MIEDAGITREQLAGSKTGVFVGIATNDYSRIHAGYSHQPQGYDLTGNCTNIAAGRLSYLFNLKGPSLAVDTACSSSLVAVHLACQSLWNDESSMAIASGCWPTATRRSCPGASSASTWCSSAPGFSPARKKPRPI